MTKRYGECDETGEAILEFDNGAIATLAAGWVDVANPVTHLISGTEGHAVVINGQTLFIAPNGEMAVPKRGQRVTYVYEERDGRNVVTSFRLGQ